ncbi:MAG: NifU family protein [Rickettsiaceae bacterium]|nr:NifU family protein [Rickettsiaceae bacterium]
MYIETEFTPNQNALKFLPGQEISPGETKFFDNIEASHESGLANQLFHIEGVKAVFFGTDFITITKHENIGWELIKPEILMTISSYLLAKLPIYRKSNSDTSFSQNIIYDNLSAIEKQIIEILDNYIRPSVAADGGDIIFVAFEDGVVKLRMQGACSGCPSSTITLKNGIESMLKQYIPEIEAVEEVI